MSLSAAGTVLVEFKLVAHHGRHRLLKPIGSVALAGRTLSLTVKR